MTTTEALPSVFAVFVLIPTFLFIYGVCWVVAGMWGKTDYEPEHWKDLP